jgi:hypothetical protein
MERSVTDGTLAYPLTPEVFNAALGYLQTALAPDVSVVADPSAPAGDTTICLTSKGHPPVIRRLARWSPGGGPASEPSAGRVEGRLNIDSIWVLKTRRHERESIRVALRAANASYVDLSGAVRIELPWLRIDRTDLRPLAAPRQLTTNDAPFADRGSLVVRQLLSSPPSRDWSVRELATAADVGLGTASRVVEQLARQQLVQSAGEPGRMAKVRVTDPEHLFERWTEHYTWERNQSLAVHAPIGDPTLFMQRLRDLVWRDARWALTLPAGAALLAPHASWERLHVYVDVADGAGLARLAQGNRWVSAPEGRLVLMRPFYRTAVWSDVRSLSTNDGGSLPVVSNLQLALDLWRYPLRGHEQAERILDLYLRPVWRQ